MTNKTPLEKDIQRSICEYLQIKRYMFWRSNTTPVFSGKDNAYRAMPKFSMSGVPDIILIKDGIFYGLEVKRLNTKQSDGQLEFEKNCIAAGGKYFVVRSIDDVIKIGL